MRRALACALGFGLIAGLGVATAQNVEVIKERQGILESFGKAAKPLGAMMKGEADFDLAKVQAALALLQEKAPKLPTLFPEDSKTGEDTEALPAIWENKADFEPRYQKLADDAKAAAAVITDQASFEENWPKVTGNCSGCHKKYRKPHDH